MNKGDKYFTYYISPTGYKQALEATFTGNFIDYKRMNENRVCVSLREAKTKAALE